MRWPSRSRVLAGLLPKAPEVHGLVALMALQASRFAARVGPGGEPVLLEDQDRSRWDRTLIAHGLRTFCDHPDQWELLHDEPDRIPAAVEELLRWVTPLNNMFRTAVRDTDINGQSVAEGERVALLYPAANRDPRRFEDPDRFDVTRKPVQHLAFGHGRHVCLGANLARLESKIALAEFLARHPAWEIPAGGAEPMHSSNVRGFAGLVVEVGDAR